MHALLLFFLWLFLSFYLTSKHVPISLLAPRLACLSRAAHPDSVVLLCRHYGSGTLVSRTAGEGGSRRYALHDAPSLLLFFSFSLTFSADAFSFTISTPCSIVYLQRVTFCLLCERNDWPMSLHGVRQAPEPASLQCPDASSLAKLSFF